MIAKCKQNKIDSSNVVYNNEPLNVVLENKMTRLYGAKTWVGNPVTATNTKININRGDGGKSLLLCVSGHISTGNSTYSGIYLIRCGYDGNNWSKTTIVEDKGDLSNIPIEFSVNDEGEFCYTVKQVAARVRIYELT